MRLLNNSASLKNSFNAELWRFQIRRPPGGLMGFGRINFCVPLLLLCCFNHHGLRKVTLILPSHCVDDFYRARRDSSIPLVPARLIFNENQLFMFKRTQIRNLQSPSQQTVTIFERCTVFNCRCTSVNPLSQ